MADCGRRKGEVPTAQSLWRIHFRDHLAAVEAIGRCRSVAEARRTAGPTRRRLCRHDHGHRGIGIVRWPGAERWPCRGSRASRRAAAPARRCGRGGGVAALRAGAIRRGRRAATSAPSSTRARGRSRVLRSRLVVAAHGSWESGALPTQDFRRPPHASDLFGFKAHFIDSALPRDLMPLLAFPGGYGGMVHTDGGRVSLSCCIRRDQLDRCRRQWPDVRAGEAVLLHIESSCTGVALALAAAKLDGVWLSSGPLRTGVRTFGRDGIFAVGNAAAEAHPIVAEGISIAIQSATLLCEQMTAHPELRCDLAHFRAGTQAYPA